MAALLNRSLVCGTQIVCHKSALAQSSGNWFCHVSVVATVRSCVELNRSVAVCWLLLIVLQVLVSLEKRILWCALIVATRVISPEHVGGLKTSVNSMEERRCNDCFWFINYFPLCYLNVFTF